MGDTLRAKEYGERYKKKLKKYLKKAKRKKLSRLDLTTVESNG